MLLCNLGGVFTGDGFETKGGRHPSIEDCGFRPGPIDIECDTKTGLISSMGPSSPKRASVEDGFLFDDLIATAGFIDSHTHALFAGSRTHEHFLRWGGASYLEITNSGGGIHSTIRQTTSKNALQLGELLIERIHSMLVHGTTSVEVKSGYASTAEGELRLLRIIREILPKRNVAEIYPTFMGLHCIPRGVSEREYCNSMIDALPLVAKDNLAYYVDAFPEKGFFSLEESLRCAHAALEYNIKAKVHADELTNMGTSRKFIQMGALSIDHLQCIDLDSVKLLATANTVATLMPATSFFLQMPYANARHLIAAGARVALATDYNPGTAPLADFQSTNLLAAINLKMTASEILCGCTYNGALALGLGDTHGIVMPNKIANILIWEVPGIELSTGGEKVLQEIFLNRLVPKAVIIRGELAARA